VSGSGTETKKIQCKKIEINKYSSIDANEELEAACCG
jgi:hypothetical protein